MSTATAARCGCAHAGCTPSEEQLFEQLAEIITSNRDKPGGLIPALQEAQALFGYLPEEAIYKIAGGFDKSISEITSVISFYSFFSLQPRGRYLIRVCLGTACYVRGGKEVLEALKRRLEINVGETTPDRLFSLEVGRCFGACGMAPVVMVNDEIFQRVKAARINELLSRIISRDETVAEEAQA